LTSPLPGSIRLFLFNGLAAVKVNPQYGIVDIFSTMVLTGPTYHRYIHFITDMDLSPAG